MTGTINGNGRAYRGIIALLLTALAIAVTVCIFLYGVNYGTDSIASTVGKVDKQAEVNTTRINNLETLLQEIRVDVREIRQAVME